MDDVEKLLALGAESVAGDLLWKHKVMGTSRNGVFQVTPEGLAALEIVDVEVKVIEPKPKKTKKVEAAEAPAADATLEALLADDPLV